MEEIERQNVTDKLLKLSNALLQTAQWTPKHAKQFNQLDLDFTTLLLTSEKILTRKKQFSWSPTLHDSYLIYTYWRKVNSALANCYAIQHDIQDIYSKLQDKLFFGNPLRHYQQQLRKAITNYIHCINTADALRDHHLTLQQELMIKQGKTTEAKAIRSIKNVERTKRMYKTLRILNKPELMNGGLSYIIDIDADGNEY